MKRFWLSLLVLVLSLQMGLATAHVCTDDLPAAASSQVQVASETAEGAEETQLSATNPLADTCCSGNVCHELHNAIDLAPAQLVLPRNTGLLVQSEARLAQGNFAVRHERPQWSAA